MAAARLVAGSKASQARGGCVCDLECDDGRTCNGRERCDAGACIDDPQGPIVCAGTRICIEALNGCQDSCEDGSGGDDITRCNDGSDDPCEDAETCDLFACNPEDANCPTDGDAYVCKSAPHHCSGAPSANSPEPCTQDADCANGDCNIEEGYCTARGRECVRSGPQAGNCEQVKGSCCTTDGSGRPTCDGTEVESCVALGGEWYSDRDPEAVSTEPAETGCTTRCPVYSSGIRPNRDLGFSVGPIVAEPGCTTIQGGLTFNEIGDDYTIVGGSYLAVERFTFTGGSLVPGGDLVIEFYDSSQNLVGRFDALGFPVGEFKWSMGSEANPLVKTSPDNLIIPPTGYVVMRSARTGIDQGVNSALTWVSTRDDPTRAGEVEIGANDPNSMWVDGLVIGFLSAGGVDGNTGLCDDGTVCELDGDPPCGDASTCTAAPDILSFAIRGTKLSEPIGACCGQTGTCTDKNPWNCSVCSISGNFCLADRDCPSGETCGGPAYLNLNEPCEVDGDCTAGAGVCQLLWNTGDLADPSNEFPPAGRCVVTCGDGSAPCDSGACCVETFCIVLTTAGGDLITQCNDLGGTFQGFGTDCDPNCCKGTIQECNPVAAAPPANDDWDESVCSAILADGTPNAGAFCWLTEPTIVVVPPSPAAPPESTAITLNPDDTIGGFCECSGIPCQQQASLGDPLACEAGICSISGDPCRSFGDCPLDEDRCAGAEECIYRDCPFPGGPDPVQWISVQTDGCALLTIDFCCTDEADTADGAIFAAYTNLHTGCTRASDQTPSQRCRVMGGAQFDNAACTTDTDCLSGLCLHARDGFGDPLVCHRDCECRDASFADGDPRWREDECQGGKACDLVDPSCGDAMIPYFPEDPSDANMRNWSADYFPGCGSGDNNPALTWRVDAGTFYYPIATAKRCVGSGTLCLTDNDCDPGDRCLDPFTRLQAHWTVKACPEAACCSVEDQCAFSLNSCVNDTDCPLKQCTDDDSACNADGDCTPGTCSVSGDPCHRTDPDCAQGSCNNSGDPCYKLADCTVADTSCDGAEVCNGGAFCQDETCEPLPFCEVVNEPTCETRPQSHWNKDEATCGIGETFVCADGACCREDLGICEDNNTGPDFGTYERCASLANTRYRGGATCPQAAGDDFPCPICPFEGPGNCQALDYQRSTSRILLSDRLSTPFPGRVADDFIAGTTGSVHRVCWTAGFVGAAGCALPGNTPPDAFEMQIYEDDGAGFIDDTLPLAPAPVALNVDSKVPGFAPPLWDYAATLSDQAAFNLTAGTCYWIEITGVGEGNGCRTYWATAEPGIGNAWSLSDIVEFGSYGPEDASAADMAFCLAVGDDLGTAPALQLAGNGQYGCGTVLGACCLCPEACVTTTFQECAVELHGTWIARTDCNEPGVCGPPRGNDLCTNATAITHKICTSDADCDGVRHCGDDPTSPCTADTDCTPGTCSGASTTCFTNAGCPVGEICENAETCSVLPESAVSVCQDDGTGTGTSICTSLLVDFDNRCAQTDGPPTRCGATHQLPSNGMHDDIWFLYAAPSCGVVTIDGCGFANNDGFSAAYLASAADCPTLTQADELACNDDGCGEGGPPSYAFAVEEGDVYLIRHGGWDDDDNSGRPGAAGQFRLRLAPQSCMGLLPPLAAPPPHNRDKNRYISFDPNLLNADIPSLAFEVLYDDGSGSDAPLGWVGPPGTGYSGAGTCVSCARVVSQADRGELSGEDWLTIASTGPGHVIHVSDCEIGPDRTYKVRAVDLGTGAFSSTLSIATTPAPNPGSIFWGDVAGDFSFWCTESYACCGDNPDCPGGTLCPGIETCVQQWAPPDGATNFFDIEAALRAFEQLGTYPETEWVDVGPETPDHVVTFEDIHLLIAAFVGDPYPFAAPTACPSSAPVCGNGVQEASEQCDDNNTVSGDGCSSDCRVEGAGSNILEWIPAGSTGPYQIVGNEITIPAGGVDVALELHVSNWSPAELSVLQATLDSASLLGENADPAAPGVDLGAADAFITEKTCHTSGDLTNTGRSCDDEPCDAGELCLNNPELLTAGLSSLPAVSTSQPDYVWAMAVISQSCVADIDPPDFKPYAGTLVVSVPVGAIGTYTIGFNRGLNESFLIDCNDASLPGVTFIPATIRLGTQPCCMPDGSCTLVELGTCAPAGGTPATLCAGDLTANGIDDACEADCDGDGTPDINEGDVAQQDCDLDGVCDGDEIASGDELDCQSNGIPDECDIRDCFAEPFCVDCNHNGVPDECETGTCCFDGDTCTDLLHADCTTQGGVFLGPCADCPTQSKRVVVHTADEMSHHFEPVVVCPDEGGAIRGLGGGCQVDTPIDPWTTAENSLSCHHFGAGLSPPIPADFFDPGSDPFTGQLCLSGVPLGVTEYGDIGIADTVVERSHDPFDRCELPSAEERIATLQMAKLSLEGQIEVTYNGGQNPELWDVFVDLSQVEPSLGEMRVTKNHCNGGVFVSTVNVQPRFTFTKVSDPTEERVLDTGLEAIPPVVLELGPPEPWVSDPDPSLKVVNPICTDLHPGLSQDVPILQCDCNNNNIRDICDIESAFSQDCNVNRIPDSCDIASTASLDTNGNAIPDECEANPALEAPVPHNRQKNRYVSFQPNNTKRVAFRVEMTASTFFGTSVGVVGWVGKPDANGVSRVVPNRVDRVWTEPIVHVGDCEIGPAATYEVRAIPDVFDGSDPLQFTAPLVLETADQPAAGTFWADATGARDTYCTGSYQVCGGRHCDDGIFSWKARPCDNDSDCKGECSNDGTACQDASECTGGATCDGVEVCVDDPPCPGAQPCETQWPPPDGTVNFTDVQATIRTFQQIGDYAHYTWVDMHGSDLSGDPAFDPPNAVPNFGDVQFIIKAFKGDSYEFAGPKDCLK